MTSRSLPRLAALACATALALVVPAAAQADEVVLASTDAEHGYRLTVLAETGDDLLTVMLVADDGQETQEHLYTFSGLDVTRNRVTGRLGRLGEIDLRFDEGRDTDLPPGCHGRVREEGVWKGDFRLEADEDFFGTIERDRLPGSLLAGRNAECDEPGEAGDEVHGTVLQASAPKRGISVVAEGRTTHVLKQDQRDGAALTHLISVPSRLDADADLRSATVTPRDDRLVSGTLEFTGRKRDATDDDGPEGVTAVGTVDGDLTAHFDSIGDVALPEDAEALLERVGGAAPAERSTRSARAADVEYGGFRPFDVDECGWKHHSRTVKFRDDFGPRYPGLSVSHQPGRYGLLTITDVATDEIVWSFRQSYAWVWGGYQVRSSRASILPGRTYRFDYWSDNLAQGFNLCNGSVFLYLEADLKYAGTIVID